MIGAVGQTFSTASYKAKNNNQNPAFGWGKPKNVKAAKKTVKNGFDFFNETCKKWDAKDAKWAKKKSNKGTVTVA